MNYFKEKQIYDIMLITHLRGAGPLNPGNDVGLGLNVRGTDVSGFGGGFDMATIIWKETIFVPSIYKLALWINVYKFTMPYLFVF